MIRHGELRLFSIPQSRPLSKLIISELGENLGPEATALESFNFSSGSFYARPECNVRDCDVFVVGSLRLDGTDVWSMMVIIQALRLASAERITAVLPFFDARQDRKTKGREPITASLALNALIHAGANRLLVFEPHIDQLQGMVDNHPLDYLFASSLFIPLIEGLRLPSDQMIIMGPDRGSINRNGFVSDYFGCEVGFTDKRRGLDRRSSIFNVVGDVAGKVVIIIDDIVDSGSSLAQAAAAIQAAGAERIIALVTHPIFSQAPQRPSAAQVVTDSCINSLYVTDSLTLPLQLADKITVIPAAPLLARAILNIHRGDSISSLIIKRH